MCTIIARWSCTRQRASLSVAYAGIRHAQRAGPRRRAALLLGVIRRRDVTAELAAIRCPALVVVGEEDKTTPPHRAERIAAGIAGSRLVRLPRCGHSSALEAPAAVNRLLLEFLATPH